MKNEYDSIVNNYAKRIENEGYTHEESLCLAKLVARVRAINPVIGFYEFMDAIESFGFVPRNRE